MKRILLLLPLLFFSCAKTVYVPVNSTHYVDRIVKDTVLDIHLVPYSDSITTTDTSSVLENKYARSSASWDGKLHHSLLVKSDPIPIRLQYIETHTIDSIQVPYKVEVIKEIPAKLNWYQRLCVKGFTVFIIAITVYLLVTFRKKLFFWK